MAKFLSTIFVSAFLFSCGTSEQESTARLSADDSSSNPSETIITIDSFRVGNETNRWNESLTVALEFTQKFTGDSVVIQPSEISADGHFPAIKHRSRAKDAAQVYRVTSLSAESILGGQRTLRAAIDSDSIILKTSAPAVFSNVKYSDSIEMQLHIYVKSYFGLDQKVSSVDLGSLDRSTKVFSIADSLTSSVIKETTEAGTSLQATVDFK